MTKFEQTGVELLEHISSANKTKAKSCFEHSCELCVRYNRPFPCEACPINLLYQSKFEENNNE